MSTTIITANNNIPYALLREELKDDAIEALEELEQIYSFYNVYERGVDFTTEGTNGDYIPSDLNFKIAASLINKEARFLFAEKPDIIIEPDSDVGKVSNETKDMITTYNNLLNTVFDANNFEEALLKASKDCFIGKRVACLVNFDDENGVTLSFLPSTNFTYRQKFGNNKVITYFCGFVSMNNARALNRRRIMKKKFELINGVVYLTESIHNGAGTLIEEITVAEKMDIKTIPVVVFVNDGLTANQQGVSEIDLLQDYEQTYSKLSNADIDAERKGMNPIRVLIDMDSNTTKGLSSSPGSLWDVTTDQNLVSSKAQAILLESGLSYATALETTLKRVKSMAYEQLDIPDISIENLQNVATSGKSLKAVYWSLVVRCKEKMKTWGAQLRTLTEIIIQGSLIYPNAVNKYINMDLQPIAFKVKIEQNLPLPEDEQEEKTMDISEVDSSLMSKKSYMKKWRQMSDDEAQAELDQIALEKQIIEEGYQNNPEKDKVETVDYTGLLNIDGIDENLQ